MEMNEDGGVEDFKGFSEQSNAVAVEPVGPWKRQDLPYRLKYRQIFQDTYEMWKYGSDIIYNAARSYQIIIVIDNSNQTQLLYPNQPNFWVGERYTDHDPILEDLELVNFKPLYKQMQTWYEEGGGPNDLKIRGSIQAGKYKNVPVLLPDPAMDYSRPIVQTSASTGKTNGTTVITTTETPPGAAGSTTKSEVVAAGVQQGDQKVYDDAILRQSAASKAKKEFTTVVTKGVDEDGFSYTETKRVEVVPGQVGPKAITAEDPLDAFGGIGDDVSSAERGRIDQIAGSGPEDGEKPCIPSNPPASDGTSGSGSTPPKAKGPDAIIAEARAKAAAPKSVLVDKAKELDPFGGAGDDVTDTAPTTVTKPPSTPTSSATTPDRPPGVYIYEPLTPGFDRYDFNSGKKVYTPNIGPSRTKEAIST
jgi:hypothetical protein